MSRTSYGQARAGKRRMENPATRKVRSMELWRRSSGRKTKATERDRPAGYVCGRTGPTYGGERDVPVDLARRLDELYVECSTERRPGGRDVHHEQMHSLFSSPGPPDGSGKGSAAQGPRTR
jgi:hypothetical protein